MRLCKRNYRRWAKNKKEYENAVWRQGMRLKINYNNMMQSALVPDGFTAEDGAYIL